MYLYMRTSEYIHNENINPITNPSFTLIFYITSSPVTPVSSFDDVNDGSRSGLAASSSMEEPKLNGSSPS